VPTNEQRGAIILVIADDEEVRDGAEALLLTDGYHVNSTRNEEEALDAAMRVRPDLILASLDQSVDNITASVRRVRLGAGLGQNVPIVMFCIVTIDEGAEVLVGENIYATRPTDFNQLREFLRRLLDRLPAAR